MKNEEHKHNWKLSHTCYEYLSNGSTTGTAMAVEVAYLVCNECESVKKVKVDSS